MLEKSTTSDELGHITGGYTFNHWHDYRLHPENGNLPQRWQALPTNLAGAHYPALTDESWRKADVWFMGNLFFYHSGNDFGAMLHRARSMNSIFGAATALLVFFWSRRLWGTTGALVSVFFCVLCPTMLAHSGLATSDMCMTFFFLAAVGAYWRHLHDHRLSSLGVSAIIFGLAGVAKYTAILLPLMAVILMVVRLGGSGPLQWGRRTFVTLPGKLAFMAASLATHGGAMVAFIWAFFGFRYSAFNPALPPGEFTLPWAMMLSFGGVKAHVIELCRTWHLLPEGYLYGLSFVLKHAEARGAFLDGEYSIYGWISFFPKTFFYKTPLSLVAGLVVGTGVFAIWLRSSNRASILQQVYRVTPLLTLFGLYWMISLASHLNIGHRHILPTYPVLYIFCGILGWAIVRCWQSARAVRAGLCVVTVGLLGWQAATAAGIYPHYLAYFSPIVGGSREGYKHLVDSSLDWGQDLPGLKQWLDANRQPQEPLYLSYFGTGDPESYGISAVLMPTIPPLNTKFPWYWCEPGLYAISASMLQHVYMTHRGPWTAENEQQFQGLRLNEANFRALKAGSHNDPKLLQGIEPAEWNRAWKLYDQLRFARLCHYLRVRHPDAMIGYSILIYRLNQGELDAAIGGDLRNLASAMNRAVTISPK